MRDTRCGYVRVMPDEAAAERSAVAAVVRQDELARNLCLLRLATHRYVTLLEHFLLEPIPDAPPSPLSRLMDDYMVVFYSYPKAS
jgi:hypothetical protein